MKRSLLTTQTCLFALFMSAILVNGHALHERQSCDSQCSSLESVVSCSNSSCLCPILNAASSTTINSCTTCLEGIPEVSMFASYLPLLGQVCTTCATPCSSLLTEILVQVPSCLTNPTTCVCTIIKSLEPQAISNCTTCLQTFDPTDLSGVLSLERQCNVSIPSTSSMSSQPQSPSSASPAVSATASTSPTQSGTEATGTQPSSSTTVVTVATSGSQNSGVDMSKYIWMMGPLLWVAFFR